MMTRSKRTHHLFLYLLISSATSISACPSTSSTQRSPSPNPAPAPIDPELAGIAPTPEEEAQAQAQAQAKTQDTAAAPTSTTTQTAATPPPQPEQALAAATTTPTTSLSTPVAYLVVPPGEVTSVSFGLKGELHIGYRDSHIARADLKRKRGNIERVYTKDHPIISIAPTGKLAVVQTPQGKVVRTKDGHVMLELHDLERMEAAQFSEDAETLFISDNKGQIHVWQKASELDSIIEKDSRLQYYVARQQPTFSAAFGQIAGPLYPNAKRVIFTRANGQLVLWDMDSPKAALSVMRHHTPISSLALRGDYLLATSKHELRVGSIKERQTLGWSKSFNADLITTTETSPETFVSLYKQRLSLHNLKDGKALWSVELEQTGAPCGLSVDPKGQHIAVCVGDTITVHEHKNGKLYRKVTRAKQKLSWR